MDILKMFHCYFFKIEKKTIKDLKIIVEKHLLLMSSDM